MLLKFIIGILFLANVVVLGLALSNLLNDRGRGDKRTARMLLLRACLGFLLVATLVIGVLTGELGVVAPWHTG